MKYLLYCIFETPPGRSISVTTPAQGPRVGVVHIQGLNIVFSEVLACDAVADTAHLVNYHRVIESFFDQVTVVPFRFGALLDAYADMERLGETRGQHYRKILRKLDGCAEMGIRAIMSEQPVPEGPRRGPCGFPSPDAPNPGKHYLAVRKAHYAAETLLAGTIEQSTEQFRRRFTGLFTDFRSEVSRSMAQRCGAEGLLLSLYFLVPQVLLGRFRDAYGALALEMPSKLLLSGPWPPYNFVLPGDSPAT